MSKSKRAKELVERIRYDVDHGKTGMKTKCERENTMLIKGMLHVLHELDYVDDSEYYELKARM
ncbi:MAG: hypothetical protein Q4F05_11440 [bacterium]|nr:hypothetical protein [bacterium]